jgi:hypothetical protein
MDISAQPAQAQLTPAPQQITNQQQAEMELAYRNHLLPQTPDCKNQLYPAGAVNLPRNTQYVNNLQYPDPWTLSNSVEQYNQVRINNWLNQRVNPPDLRTPDFVSQRYAQTPNVLNEGFHGGAPHHHAHAWSDLDLESGRTRGFLALILLAMILCFFAYSRKR